MTNYEGGVALALMDTAGGALVFAGMGLAGLALAVFGKRKPPPQPEPQPQREPGERFYAREIAGQWFVYDRDGRLLTADWMIPIRVRSYTTRRAAMLGAKRLNDRAARGQQYLPEALRRW